MRRSGCAIEGIPAGYGVVIAGTGAALQSNRRHAEINAVRAILASVYSEDNHELVNAKIMKMEE